MQILIAEATGVLSSLLSRNGMEQFQLTASQPAFAPPASLFSIVWSILYALMGISAARILLATPTSNKHKSINLYITQLIVNFFWSLIFFNAGAYASAFIWLLLLWILVLMMAVRMYQTDKLAGLIQIPYILWLTFAGILNFYDWQLNR